MRQASADEMRALRQAWRDRLVRRVPDQESLLGDKNLKIKAKISWCASTEEDGDSESDIYVVMCRAGPGSNTRGRAQLWRARAHLNLEPGPGYRAGLGSGRVGLKPGLIG